MIVKDESKVIGECLASLSSVVDEIILVDTGSTDNTVEIARQYPIQLYHFAWCNDFSAARNFALEQAKGDWILYIDADERASIPLNADIDPDLADESLVSLAVRFHPRIGWTPYAELRLFRNDPRIRFEGVVHETMRPGIERVCAEDGRRTGFTPLTIQHVGYETDQAYKNPRNIPLLRNRLAENPDHAYAWWHLGHCLSLDGLDEEAIEAWRKGVDAARRKTSVIGPLADSLPALSLISALARRKEPIDALLAEWLERCPNHKGLKLVAATHQLEQGDAAAAQADLEMLSAIDPDTFFDPQIAYEKDLFRVHAKDALALSYFRTGQYRASAELYRSLASVHPDPQSCITKARFAELRAASG